MPAIELPSLPASLPRADLAEALLLRICRTAHAGHEPGFRAAGIYRFDSPDQSFGTCYLARDFKTCFLETVVRNRSLRIPHSEYTSRSLAVLLVDASKLRLVPVHGDGAITLRVNMADLAGADYAYTQALAKAMHDHPDAPDGIVYRSRFDDGALAVALFDRAKEHVRLLPSTAPIPLADVHELADALRTSIRFELVPPAKSP